MIVLTTKETADKLKVSTSTVIKMFDEKILPGIVLKRGLRKRILRFRLEAIEEFLKG